MMLRSGLSGRRWRRCLTIAPVAITVAALAGCGKSDDAAWDTGPVRWPLGCPTTDVAPGFDAAGAPATGTCEADAPALSPSLVTPSSCNQAVDLLGRMTADEKLALLSGDDHSTKGTTWDSDFNATGVARLGIPDWRMVDGRHGLHILSGGKATTWAVTVARAAAFDPDLEYRIGVAMGQEAMALKYDLVLAPIASTLYHPLWARAQETYGEDPALQGEMGAAFVRGIQQSVVACAMFLAGYTSDDNRQNVIAQLDEQTLHENFLRPLKTLVEKANPGCMMAAYNGVKGTPSSAWYTGASDGWCTENEYVLKTVPRTGWGWQGVMVSDWWATRGHADLSMNAGLDLEMPDNSTFGALSSVIPTAVPAARIYEAGLRILNVRARFNQLTENARSPDTSFLLDQTHIALARESAEKGAVLLKNDNVLPLPVAATVIFLGPDGDLPNANRIQPNNASGLGDRGSGATNPPYAVSFQKGLDEKGFTTTMSPNAADAANADIAIIPISMAHEDEGEAFDNGHDRIDLGLGANHPKHWFAAGINPAAFIKQAAAANPKTIVLLLVGGAVVMEDWIDSVPGIVQTFYPGQEAGRALARLLTGEINFSGKLPFTVAKNPQDYPLFDNKSASTMIEYLHGYRRIEANAAPARFWFGFGKSYTTYAYANVQSLCASGIAENGRLAVTVDVTNTGAVQGTEIVQMYVGGFPPGPRRPPKELEAFTRVTLAPSETKTVTLSVAAKDLAHWDQTTHRWVVSKGTHTVFVGPSADPATLLSSSFTIN